MGWRVVIWAVRWTDRRSKPHCSGSSTCAPAWVTDRSGRKGEGGQPKLVVGGTSRGCSIFIRRLRYDSAMAFTAGINGMSQSMTCVVAGRVLLPAFPA